MITGKLSRKPDILLSGSIVKGILSFAIPMFIGQLLQQLYNVADAWVIGNFADNASFAAVSSSGNLIFLIIGFFGGISMGGSVVISKYYGAKEEENVSKAVHMLFLFGIAASVLATAAGLIMMPGILVMMGTPDSVLPFSLIYFRVYFAGVSSVIMYNICMAIMRALGDSINPLIYLCISSVANIVLDLLFVAVFSWGVAGAGIATVLSQLLSVILCIIKMIKPDNTVRLELKKLVPDFRVLRDVVLMGLPSGIQNAVISMGNIAVQSAINSFGEFAVAGAGAQGKIEGFVFIPINAISMAMPTFIGQNLGAKQFDRAKKGAVFGVAFGAGLAELTGIIIYFSAPLFLRLFVNEKQSIEFGLIHLHTTCLFYCLLAFSHCAAGVLRGCGRAAIPMVGMLGSWCAVRITYVTVILKFINEYRMISWAYPLTWSITTVAFGIFLLKSDWTHTFEKKQKHS